MTARRILPGVAEGPVLAMAEGLSFWGGVDPGTARALLAGKSLLPAGVRAVEGAFERGDAVEVRGADGAALARGLSAYGAADAARIAGHRSAAIEAILGWRGRDEMIHRDDLVVLHAAP